MLAKSVFPAVEAVPATVDFGKMLVARPVQMVVQVRSFPPAAVARRRPSSIALPTQLPRDSHSPGDSVAEARAALQIGNVSTANLEWKLVGASDKNFSVDRSV
jgi:hypothetical protein